MRNSAKYFFDRTFKDFHTRHQKELLRKFYSATYFSRSNISNTYISSSKIRHVTFVDLNIRHRMAPLRRFMLDNLELLFFKVNISNVNIYETLRDGAKIIIIFDLERFFFCHRLDNCKVVLSELDLHF